MAGERRDGDRGPGDASGLDLVGYFEAVFAHSPDGVLLTRSDGSVLRANPAACRLLRRAEGELRRLGRQGLVVPGSGLEALLESRERNGVAHGPIAYRLPDGSALSVDCLSARLPGGDGRSTLVIFRDASERERAALALQESEALHRLLFTLAPAGVLLCDERGVIQAFNDRAASQLGYTREEFARLTIADIDVEDDRRAVARRAAQAAEAGSLEFEARQRHRSGEIRDVLVKIRRVPLGQRTLLLSVWEDVTERKRAEEAERLEALGRLAGGVAHDFNNLLTVILSCVELLRGQAAAGTRAAGEIEEIGTAGLRARDLVRELLTFSRRQPVAPVPLDLEAAVRSAAGLLRRLVPEDVEIALAPSPEPSVVRIDRAQLELLVLNLGVNARDAMPEGGRVTLETAHVDADDALCARFPGLRPGAWVRLAVSDTGCGMPREVREHLFEPFFTTKPVGAGTGLGLSAVHGIVKQAGGAIRFDSEPGRGTRFEVMLPRITGCPAELPAPTPVPIPGERERTILLAEDEPTVRAVTERALRGAGYRVISVAGGAEALVRLEELGASVDLLVTDAVMPDMDGLALSEAVKARCPGVRVLMVTGHPDELLSRRGLSPGQVDMLLKPYAPGALLARVRAALQRSR